MAARDMIWIPAVPLPFMGMFTDACECGALFRSLDAARRRHAYELHYRREHQRADTADDQPMVAVRRDEAERIYREVNSDTESVPPERSRDES